MTLGIMAFFGVDVVFEGNTLKVPSMKYQPQTFHVEADWSAASYFYEIAAFSESASIKLNGLHKNSLQGDADVAKICKKLGMETLYDEYSITLKKAKDTVYPQNLEYNFINVPDIAQSISVLCAGIGCNVLFTGLQTLKIKETDRISALKNEHAKMNVFFSKMPERFSSKTAKMPIPPREGVLILCDRRSPGSSIRFFFIARFMMDGMARYVSAKDVIKAKMTSYIYYLKLGRSKVTKIMTLRYINFHFSSEIINPRSEISFQKPG